MCAVRQNSLLPLTETEVVFKFGVYFGRDQTVRWRRFAYALAAPQNKRERQIFDFPFAAELAAHEIKAVFDPARVAAKKSSLAVMEFSRAENRLEK